jgi:hypothetical protein
MADERGRARRNRRRHGVLPAIAAAIVLGEIGWLVLCLV